MKSYPSIDYFNQIGGWGEKIYAFDKLDGNNIRAEWRRKKGWCKFGTKNVMIDEKNEQFGHVIPLFLDKYGDALEEVFKNKKEYRNVDNFVVFCEYYGENSFAGRHKEGDEMRITLFDVNQDRKGFITPKEFINNFGHLDIPKLIYHGNFNKEFIQEVKDNKYGLKEGVICKGSKLTKSQEIVWMVKVKTNDWLDKIRKNYGEDVLLKEVNGNKSLLVNRSMV